MPSTLPPTLRRHRSDGARSRQTILRAAANVATVEGLDGLSIGRLADHTGMSKSGLFGLFGSKEELQLATIASAREIFDAEVYAAAAEAPPGIPWVLAFCDAFLDHLRRQVFPGGCFFAAVGAQVAARPGPIRDAISAFNGDMFTRILENLVVARDAGGLPPTADLDQLVFEIDSHLIHAHSASAGGVSEAALERARTAIVRLLCAPR